MNHRVLSFKFAFLIFLLSNNHFAVNTAEIIHVKEIAKLGFEIKSNINKLQELIAKAEFCSKLIVLT